MEILAFDLEYDSSTKQRKSQILDLVDGPVAALSEQLFHLRYSNPSWSQTDSIAYCILVVLALDGVILLRQKGRGSLVSVGLWRGCHGEGERGTG